MTREEMLQRLNGQEDALTLSIEKWEDILGYKGVSDGANNCALCEMYMDSGGIFCAGCPIAQSTGYQLCHRTHYLKFVIHHQKAHPKVKEYGRVKGCRTCSKWIRAEIAFLKGLKP